MNDWDFDAPDDDTFGCVFVWAILLALWIASTVFLHTMWNWIVVTLWPVVALSWPAAALVTFVLLAFFVQVVQEHTREEGE